MADNEKPTASAAPQLDAAIRPSRPDGLDTDRPLGFQDISRLTAIMHGNAAIVLAVQDGQGNTGTLALDGDTLRIHTGPGGREKLLFESHSRNFRLTPGSRAAITALSTTTSNAVATASKPSTTPPEEREAALTEFNGLLVKIFRREPGDYNRDSTSIPFVCRAKPMTNLVACAQSASLTIVGELPSFPIRIEGENLAKAIKRAFNQTGQSSLNDVLLGSDDTATGACVIVLSMASENGTVEVMNAKGARGRR